MKTLLRLLLRAWFRFRCFNSGVLATRGPVLLVPNHVSWLDWLFLYAVLDDDWKFVAATSTARLSWLHRRIVTNARTLPIDPSSPHAVRALADHLEQGGRLVLFAEGRISTTGSLMKLFDGTGFLVRRTGAKVITCYLRGANRVRWVRHEGWTQWRPTVTAHFSAVLTPPAFNELSHGEARTRITQWLRDRMVDQQFEVEQAFGAPTLLSAITDTAAARPRQIALEDATQQTLTFRQLTRGSRALAAALNPHLAPSAHGRTGIMLPNVNAVPMVLMALWRQRRVPTVLNFSTGAATMLGCARLAGLTEIVTSRTFVARAKLDPAPFAAAGIKIVYLEDVRARMSLGAKLAALRPEALTRGGAQRDDTAVVLFTSGSEGVPKAVELTHGNLLANVRQSLAAMDVTDRDRWFNALPLFHSFGLTAGTLLPLIRGCYTYLFPSPLLYRAIPAAVYDRNCTVMLATNTFLNGYARKGQPYDFRTLRYLMAGAEKVQAATLELWARKFGVRILEGYGATECGPVVSVNTWLEPRVGTAGRLLPGVEYRLETVSGIEQGGRLFVRGPNIMKGYLNPEANARFLADGGWYDTGDIAAIDERGFVQLLGRMKRFAKVSGEMVSLTAVEDALAGAFPHLGPKCDVAVITRPDAEKGECLVAFTNEPRLTLPEVRSALRARGLSNLCAPREIHVVPALPKLGTGKTDYRTLTTLLPQPLAA